MNRSKRSLCGYGQKILERDNWICQYCGFDGRAFNNWLQMSIDHILPRSAGGDDSPDNLVAACKACNSFSCRMTFPRSMDKTAIFGEKKRHIQARRKLFLKIWETEVAPLIEP